MQTALITGASGGIGFELAQIFANKGVNLILVARNEQKLNEIAANFSDKGISVTCYAKDLSNLTNAQDIIADLEMNNKIPDYWVNNAGFGLDAPEIEADWQQELEMLNLNMVTLTYFTKTIAKAMVKRGSGRILNVASIAAFQPGPYMAGYCATKSYVLSFSEAVNYELKGTGVSISTLCPGVTDTGFHVRANTLSSGMFTKLSHALAKDVALYGYHLMMQRKAVGVYGWMNKLMTFSVRFSPRSFVLWLSCALLKK
jgi:short-subunit dehydrogenase